MRATKKSRMRECSSFQSICVFFFASSVHHHTDQFPHLLQFSHQKYTCSATCSEIPSRPCKVVRQHKSRHRLLCVGGGEQKKMERKNTSFKHQFSLHVACMRPTSHFMSGRQKWKNIVKCLCYFFCLHCKCSSRARNFSHNFHR